MFKAVGETIIVSADAVVEAFWYCDHDFSGATWIDPKTTACVTTGTATGDTSAPALWVGLVTVAGLAAFVADKKRRF